MESDYSDNGPPGPSQQEESLTTTLDRAGAGLQDVAEQITRFTSDLSRLKTQCTALKQERTALQAEIAAEGQSRASLLADVERLRAERDSLQIEYSALREDERFWRDADGLASAKLDEQGKLARRLWFATEKVRELERRLADAESEHRGEIEAEQAMSQALRARIGVLERKVREGKNAAEGSKAAKAGSACEEGPYCSHEHDAAVLKADLDRQKSDFRDQRHSLSRETRMRAEAEKRAEELEYQLQLAREDALHFKPAKDERDQLRERLRSTEEQLKSANAVKSTPAGEHTGQEGTTATVQPRSPSRALQRVSSNAPRTPTKPPSSASPFPSPGAGPVSPGSLPKRYAHLESQHRALKTAFDRLRANHASDIKHWKEYRAVEMAKREIKQKKREKRAAEERASASARASGDSTSRASGAPSSIASQEAGVGVAVDAVMDDADAPQERPPTAPLLSAQLVSETVTPPAPRPAHDPSLPPAEPAAPVQAQAPPSAQPQPRPRPARISDSADSMVAELIPPPSRQAQGSRNPSPEKQSTPAAVHTPSDTAKRLTRVPSRVTPWLGASSKPSKSTPASTSAKRWNRDSFGSDDDEPTTPVASTIKKPLVRDRIGSSATTSTSKAEGSGLLRRRALERTAASATGISAGDAQTPTSKGNKHPVLEMEGLSPAERAAERHKLRRLSTTERREIYAPYKGKGRYVAPEDVHRGVADDYEIDPARNGGAAYAYHDVVRNREARKQMHGGDCECCRDYYEAIGPLPRFNTGPVWNDEVDAPDPGNPDPDAHDTGGGSKHTREIEDHQRRVSRHRETWRKPPTPPDFWKIGFPDTQAVREVNARADKMVAQREAEIRREAAHRDSKWRRKA